MFAVEEAAARRRPPAEPFAWPVEGQIGAVRPPGRVHVATCRDTGKRCAPATADQIRKLLAQAWPPALQCRPDTALVSAYA
ncbi:MULTISPECIES: DUF6233 domain-containing protein [unclassified Streptomyces]|uniref:DUF6233 domain-containing protein n=1 Tax=unclassified Streptomyces TaxID=2593676 RepID=UPI002E32BECA|nr:MULTISPECIES: DUF6233 domain-containing protein [unclassified Streptomyces]WUC68526.1 DUF6233 domain-containing protein [Streptomyces sp. NBC_00539]